MVLENYVKCAALREKLTIRDQTLLLSVGFVNCDVIPELPNQEKEQILPDGSLILKDNKYFPSLQEPENDGDFDMNRFTKGQSEKKLEKDDVEVPKPILQRKKKIEEEKTENTKDSNWEKYYDQYDRTSTDKFEGKSDENTERILEDQLIRNSLLPTSGSFSNEEDGMEILDFIRGKKKKKTISAKEKRDNAQKMIMFSPPSYFKNNGNKRRISPPKQKKTEPLYFDISKMDLESSRIEKEMTKMKRSFEKKREEFENVKRKSTPSAHRHHKEEDLKRRSALKKERKERKISPEKSPVNESKKIENIETILNDFRKSSSETIISKEEFYEMCSDLKKEINSIREDSKKKEGMFTDLKKMIKDHHVVTTEKPNFLKEPVIPTPSKVQKKKKKTYYRSPSPRRRNKPIDLSLLVDDPSIEDEVKHEELDRFRKQLEEREKQILEREKGEKERHEYHIILNRTLKQENDGLRRVVKKFKKEMGKRKNTLEYEFRNLHCLVLDHDDVVDDKKKKKTIYPPLLLEDLKKMNDLEIRLVKLEKETSKHHTHGYYPKDIHDPVDHAVSRILKNIPVVGDVRVEVEKIGTGEYLADRLLKVRLSRRGNDDDQVVISNMRDLSLRSYLLELYSPFLQDVYRKKYPRQKQQQYGNIDNGMVMVNNNNKSQKSEYNHHHHRIQQNEMSVPPTLRRRKNIYGYDEQEGNNNVIVHKNDKFFEYGGSKSHQDLLMGSPQHIVFDYKSHPSFNNNNNTVGEYQQQQKRRIIRKKKKEEARMNYMERKNRTLDPVRRRRRKEDEFSYRYDDGDFDQQVTNNNNKKKKKVMSRSFSGTSRGKYFITSQRQQQRYMRPTKQSFARRTNKKRRVSYDNYFVDNDKKKTRNRYY